MILNSVRTIVPNAFVDLISLSITVLLLFSSYKRHSRGSKCLNDLLKATHKWWSWDSKPHLQAANPAVNHCKVVLTPFIPEGRGRILPFFLHCFHNITQCPALLINRVDGLKFFPFQATFQAWAIIHSYCGISRHRSPRQRVRIMLSTRYTPRPYARAVWATSEIDYTVLWLKEILLHLGRIRCEQLEQIVRNQNVPKHLPRKKKNPELNQESYGIAASLWEEKNLHQGWGHLNWPLRNGWNEVGGRTLPRWGTVRMRSWVQMFSSSSSSFPMPWASLLLHFPLYKAWVMIQYITYT